MSSVPKSSSRIAGSQIAVLDPPVPTSNKPLRSSCERRFRPCDARAWFPLFSQEADVLLFAILLRVHADIRDVIGENNSGSRQRRLVNLIRGLIATNN